MRERTFSSVVVGVASGSLVVVVVVLVPSAVDWAVVDEEEEDPAAPESVALGAPARERPRVLLMRALERPEKPRWASLPRSVSSFEASW